MKKHDLALSHLMEVDKRKDDQDIKKSSLELSIWCSSNASIMNGLKKKVHMQIMNGVELGNYFKNIIGSRRNMRHEHE